MKLDKDIRGFLDHILQTHYGHTSVKFEIIHSSWGQLMRHIRKGRLEYAKIPLNDLYRLKLREGAAPVL